MCLSCRRERREAKRKGGRDQKGEEIFVLIEQWLHQWHRQFIRSTGFTKVSTRHHLRLGFCQRQLIHSQLNLIQQVTMSQVMRMSQEIRIVASHVEARKTICRGRIEDQTQSIQEWKGLSVSLGSMCWVGRKMNRHLRLRPESAWTRIQISLCCY